MEDIAAVRVALDLMHVPSRVRLARTNPLPDGMALLLRIAAGDGDAQMVAMEVTGRSADTIQRAAEFFIEQVMLFPEADSYRVLGASSSASFSELRRNMAHLVRWLHPDAQYVGDRSVFVSRVTLAWDNLKTPERRDAYDAALHSVRRKGANHVRRHKTKPALEYDGRDLYPSPRAGGVRGLLRRMLFRGGIR